MGTHLFDELLIAVADGCVDVPVASPEGSQARLDALGRVANLIGAQAEQRQGCA
jgi:hypothetical protein